MSGPLSSRLPLSREHLDRDALGRSSSAVLRTDPAVRALVLWRGNALLAADVPCRLELVPLSVLPAGSDLIYLGRTLPDDVEFADSTPLVTVAVDDAAANALAPDPSRWAGLRSIATELGDRDAGMFTEALAITNWHASHGFSPRTGEPTVSGEGGWVRHPAGSENEKSGAHIFPRTDPAVIVAVIDEDDRLLLGSNAQWDANRYSLLAGFVEPGESLEAAVAREIFEESGLHVIDAVYLGSQPWPFPASLMVGFSARVDGDRPTSLRPDGTEILDLRWFTREELAAALGTVLLPGRASIARAIIEQWYGGPLADEPLPTESR